MSFLNELRRRKVVKVAVAYAIVGWLLVEVAATVLPIFEAPGWVTQVFTFFVILGFPLALVLSWAFDVTPEGITTTPSEQAAESVAPATGQRLNYAILIIMALAVVFLVFEQFVLQRQVSSITASNSAGATMGIQRLSIDIGPTEPIGNTGLSAHLDISPDGSRMVYSAQIEGQTQLYLRSLDEFEATAIPGTEGGYHPFFSPDGESIAFYSDTTDQMLKRVPLSGGVPVALADTPFSPGGAWSANDRIIFANGSISGSRSLEVVEANGDQPEFLLPPSDQIWPIFPDLLPGGNALLFTARPANEPASAGSIAVLSLETGEYETLIENGHTARYTPTGHIVFVRGNSLWAVSFDPVTLATSGREVEVLNDVEADSQLGGAPYAFSDEGLLVYLAGGFAEATYNLVWVDREGQEEIIATEARLFQHPSLSPDGSRLAFSVLETGGIDIYIHDLERDSTSRRFTFDSAYDYAPVWAPDGEYIVFHSARNGGGLYRKNADGTGRPELLLSNSSLPIPDSFTPDGSELIFQAGEPPVLYALSLDDDLAPRQLTQTRVRSTHAAISPNGRWLAYVRDETGRDEVYVVPYPDTEEGTWQISANGGTEPRWSADGSELFFFATLGGPFTAVPVETETSFSTGVPVGLFTASYLSTEVHNYAVAGDGQRFLVIRPVASADTEAGVTLLSVVNNWFEELRRLASPDSQE